MKILLIVLWILGVSTVLMVVGASRQDQQAQCQQEIALLRSLLGNRDETIEIQAQQIIQLNAKLAALQKEAEKKAEEKK